MPGGNEKKEKAESVLSVSPPTHVHLSLRPLDGRSNIVLSASRSYIPTRRRIEYDFVASHPISPFHSIVCNLKNKKATVVDLSSSLVSLSQNKNQSGEHKKRQLGIMTRRRRISLQVKSVKSRFGAKQNVVGKMQRPFDQGLHFRMGWTTLLRTKVCVTLNRNEIFRSTHYQNILVGGLKKILGFKMKWKNKALL
jgi:hypothetical protein